MNRWVRYLLSMVLCFGVLTAAWACPAHTERAVARQEINPMTKVSAPLRSTWAEREATRSSGKRVECFVKIDGTYTDNVAAALKQAGFAARSVVPHVISPATGDQRPATIITGAIRLDKLFDLADLTFVMSVEGAAPVGKKTITKHHIPITK